ncbi:uncharacterized protein LOC132633727 isoform X2 [Lycium barbarum]|uniref:uncharacterized protein LOC132633727 isoform X2 n=1 Tax=Lycium barbarum TaxID=112863 RepID=UPI00293EC26C|nr:uncharacterized protein LOC132633727 isoform X2 [Lycium barbarum]
MASSSQRSVKNYFTKVPKSSVASSSQPNQEANANHSEVPLPYSPMIQKDIVSACKIETIKAILEELNGDYFSLLVDESFDVSRKEQMAIVLRYIDRNGFVMERLLDIVHVLDTSALSLKRAIINLLAQHSLSLSYVRG